MIHGDPNTYTNDRCRCDLCRRAAVRRMKLYRVTAQPNRDGVPAIPVLVDIAPVRAHVASLRASGWRLGDIAAEVEMSRAHLSWTMSRGNDSAKIRRERAESILSLAPLEPVDIDRVVVDRLIAGADWRTMPAHPTNWRAERIAAAVVLPGTHHKRLGLRAADCLAAAS